MTTVPVNNVPVTDEPVPRRRGSRILDAILSNLAFPVLLIALWALSTIATPIKFFPGPDRVIKAFVDTWLGDAFVEDVLPSLIRLAVGIVASVVLGIALGTLIGSFRTLRAFLEPILEFFRAVPPPVVIPVLVILLGITDEMKIVVIISGAIWPVLLNTVEGVRAVDPVMRETAQAYGLNRRTRVFSLVLPAAAPQIMAGVRQSFSVALILMVISELFYSSSGLGYQIKYFQTNYQIPQMWSGILLLGLIGVALSLIFRVVERGVLHWYHGLKEVERA